MCKKYSQTGEELNWVPGGYWAGGSWRLLVGAGGSWWFLVAPGGSRRLLVSFDGSGKLLVVPMALGGSRWFLVTPGSSWWLLVAPKWPRIFPSPSPSPNLPPPNPTQHKPHGPRCHARNPQAPLSHSLSAKTTPHAGGGLGKNVTWDFRRKRPRNPRS